IVYWILVLLFLGIFYPADPPAQAGALVILAIAFLGSLLFTRRMKRKQKARREAEDRVKQMQEAYQMQQMTQLAATELPGRPDRVGGVPRLAESRGESSS